MARLKLYGMRAAYDEVMTTGIKRRHEPPRIVGDLLSAEIAEKQARSIKYRGHRAPRIRRDHQAGPGGLAGPPAIGHKSHSATLTCRRKIEMSPCAQSRDDITPGG